MRKVLALVVAAATGLMVSAGTAFAQTAPTTATALAQTIDLSDAKSAGLIIVGLMVAAGVVLWGARLVLSKFKPKI
ncbi:MAG TPA: hypothetical protein PKZ22_03505 [Accumulibacter sp.]|jgi:di/tricarboxylate transporter|nr:hypothetical protein [Accumulibacter sp.]